MNNTEYAVLFEDKDKRTRALNDLGSLRSHPGWQLVTQMLNVLIKDREQRILDNEVLTEEERKDLKIQRKDFIFMRDLPEDTIRDLMEYTKVQAVNPDPYE